MFISGLKDFFIFREGQFLEMKNYLNKGTKGQKVGFIHLHI